MKIFVFDKDRRHFARKGQHHAIKLERREAEAGSRRYLLIVSDPALEETLKRQLASGATRVYPHESGDEYLFYCVTGHSNDEQFVADLFEKLRSESERRPDMDGLEVHLCKAEENAVVPVSYRLRENHLVRTSL